MIKNNHVDAWVSKKIITKAQAEKIKKELSHENSQKNSSRILAALTTVGAILLGLGAIMFIASNWQSMSKFMKIFVITGSTFLSYFTGYYLRYHKKFHQTLGTSLLFLSALLFGASLILISQIYHISGEMHWLIFTWLIGTLPLTYSTKNYPFALLSVALIFTWFVYYLDQAPNLDEIIAYTILFSSITFFSIGNIHSRFPALKKIGKPLTFVSINIALLTFLFFTFEDFVNDFSLTRETMVYVIVPLATAFIAILAELLLAPHKKIDMLEKSFPLVVILTSLLTFLAKSNIASTSLLIFYNLLFFGLSGFILYLGYRKHSVDIIRLGMFWLTIIITAKYFDFFWDLLDRSIFFLAGGVALIIGSVFFERKLQQLKHTFND